MDNVFVKIIETILNSSDSGEAFAVIVAIVLLYILLIRLARIEENVQNTYMKLDYMTRMVEMLLQNKIRTKEVTHE